MLEAGLILSRFLHYTAVLVLFGASLFPFYAFPDRVDQKSARSDHWVHRVVLGAALVALLSSLPWLAFTTANMAGTPSAATDPDALRSVMGDTAFGHVWIVRLGLVLTILGALSLRIASKADRHWNIYTPLLAGLLLAGLAGVGHTQQSNGIIHVGADALHLLAAGAWIGGLLVLGYILAYDQEDAEPVLMRFSGMGYVAVAVLVASGLVNGWYLVGSLNGLVGTSYGQLLLVKLCLFAGMLCLAITNRFWLVPSLRGIDEAGRVLSLASLRRHIVAEWTLGLLVILIVSALGTMEPASP
jgi:putative copper resistance protein D